LPKFYKMKNLLLLLFLISALASFSQQGPIITDRPDQTEASSTIPAGYLQVETGMTFMQEGISSIRELHSNALPNTLFRVGVWKYFELRAVVQPTLVKEFVNDIEVSRDFQMDDLQAGFKVQFCEAKGARPEIGFLSHVVFPTGSESTTNTFGVINKLAFTHPVNNKHTIAYNIGYDYLGVGSGNLFYSLAWGISLSDKIGLYVEPYGFVNNLETWLSNADAGMTYLLSDNVQLDYSFGVGLNNVMNYHSLGISFRLPN
jgi:hypothetical protein